MKRVGTDGYICLSSAVLNNCLYSYVLIVKKHGPLDVILNIACYNPVTNRWKCTKISGTDHPDADDNKFIRALNGLLYIISGNSCMTFDPESEKVEQVNYFHMLTLTLIIIFLILHENDGNSQIAAMKEMLCQNVIVTEKGLLAVGVKINHENESCEEDDQHSVMQEYDYKKNEWTVIEAPMKCTDNRCLVWISKSTLTSLLDSVKDE